MLSMLTIDLETDPALICRLSRRVQEDHVHRRPDVFAPFDREALLPWFTSLLNQEGVFCLLARVEDHPVGYVLCVHKHSDGNPFLQPGAQWIHVDQMSVEKDFQGRGVGRALLAEVIRIARQRGVTRLTLNVWDDNEGALGFYQHLGLRPFRRDMELWL